MSVRTMARVWDCSQHSGTELLMLLAIADFADDDGRAYPAVGTLARKCRMTARNANRLLNGLKASGELEIKGNEGPRGTNRYRVTVGLTPTSPLTPTSSLTRRSSTPDEFVLKPLTPASDEPSLNHQEPLGKNCRAKSPEEPPGFAMFWKAWPTHRRKADREGCLKVWKANRCEASAEEIVIKVEAWKRSPDWTKDTGQYIPAPLRWLRDHRYEAPTPLMAASPARKWITSGGV